MPERNAESFEVAIIQLGQQIEIDIIGDEGFEALAKSEVIQPTAQLARQR